MWKKCREIPTLNLQWANGASSPHPSPAMWRQESGSPRSPGYKEKADFCKLSAVLFAYVMHTSLALSNINVSLWWLTPVIQTLRKLRQNDCSYFETSLGCRLRPCLKRNKKKLQFRASAINSTHCSCREPEFGFQHPYSGLQLHKTPVPRDPTSLEGTRHTGGTHIYM